uniref:ubiquitin carboxyl-terminal hydrolase MINDY-1-like n=1 Tax=Erigeron canadensis TaxID=72917 RepID=UPI001CB92BA3|nr:ubiquitin carboxyl-terminal hydrolase MINDY-1-like [Erigeron canadensis]
MASPAEEREDTPTVKDLMHKTKVIQFFGRDTPIILQNDNGPCPLLAICNILLLRNNLSLSSDVAEVSQEKLLSLVAESLIDSNSNSDNKDVGYVENQQQNIADAIDILPRLATGIDVNIKFRRIHDFEFTRECAIFDLLGISLYHGWIVDPQDSDTSNAIGSKSYNMLMGELVDLETQNMGSVTKNNPDLDSIDFVASTTVIPEETEPFSTLKPSTTVKPPSENEVIVVGTVEETLSTISNSDSSRLVNNYNDDMITFEKVPGEDVGSSLEADKESDNGQINSSISKKNEGTGGIEKTNIEVLDRTVNDSLSLCGLDSSPPPVDELICNGDVNEVKSMSNEKMSNESCSSEPNVALESSNGMVQTIVGPDSLVSTPDGNETISKEKCILETGTTRNEGEVVMSEQVHKDGTSADVTRPKDGTTPGQGELIRTFLKNNASQMTIYGLFSLQEGVKENELCVFFRNNHFNTMFKFEGELYILATDLGYINQPDLVWEKLNEVNGDTMFMTSDFKEFKVENHETRAWDEQNVMSSTADYIARMDNTAEGGTEINSDLQLAIALQQQEFEQQQQQQQQHQQQRQQPQRTSPQSPTTSCSGLVVGPKHVHPARPRNSASSSSKESKPDKDKCNVM